MPKSRSRRSQEREDASKSGAFAISKDGFVRNRNNQTDMSRAKAVGAARSRGDKDPTIRDLEKAGSGVVDDTKRSRELKKRHGNPKLR